MSSEKITDYVETPIEIKEDAGARIGDMKVGTFMGGKFSDGGESEAQLEKDLNKAQAQKLGRGTMRQIVNFGAWRDDRLAYLKKVA